MDKTNITPARLALFTRKRQGKEIKKSLFLLCLFGLLPTVALAQQVVHSDSTLQRKLDEVTVEAATQYASANGTTYFPDRNAKRTAQNALDLLSRMAIPQISVNPIASSVQTNGGSDVAIFIDYEPASEAEKDAINPQDVKKVEYLVRPSDPRFNNEQYVINIVLFHYDYGGYGKITGVGNILDGSGSGQVYAKTGYKRMTYDVSFSDKYIDRKHCGVEQSQMFRLPQADGSIAEVTRATTLDAGRYQQNYLLGSLRAKYATEKTSISNTLNIAAKRNPHEDYSGRVVFSGPSFPTTESPYSNLADNSVLNPYWNGYYYFDFGRRWKLNLMPMLNYAHTVSNRRYRSDETDIVTDATEDMLTAQVHATLNKTFREGHTLGLFLYGLYIHDRIRYTGSTPASPVFDQYVWTVLPTYAVAKDKYSIKLSGGMVSESNTISGVRTNSLRPFLQLDAVYSPNEKNQIEFSAKYKLSPMELANKTPDVLQSNELLYTTGNPRLKNASWTAGKASYSWFPGNALSLSVSGGWEKIYDWMMPVFRPDGPDGLMLRSLENDGDYRSFNLGASLSLRLFRRALVLTARPRVYFERMTGTYAARNTFLSLPLSATYHLKNFYFTAMYTPGYKDFLFNDLNATKSRGKDYYYFTAGWSNGKWNVSATAINIFRRSWLEKTAWLNSQWFDQTTKTYSSYAHQFIKLTASYTLNFGKKIRQGDELENTSSSSSAIMK